MGYKFAQAKLAASVRSPSLSPDCEARGQPYRRKNVLNAEVLNKNAVETGTHAGMFLGP